jgi:hypothetical protein
MNLIEKANDKLYLSRQAIAMKVKTAFITMSYSVINLQNYGMMRVHVVLVGVPFITFVTTNVVAM